MAEIIVEVQHLKKTYTDDAGKFDVLKDISSLLKRGDGRVAWNFRCRKNYASSNSGGTR